MNKEPENTNKELLKLKQELKELNHKISTQKVHIQKLCSEVEEREKELRFHHKAEKIINNAALSPEKIFQKVVDILPEAFQFPEIIAISLKIDGWIFNSKGFIDSNIFIETNIQIEDSLVGFIKACYKNDGHQKVSKKFLKEEKDLLRILSKRLSEYYAKYLNHLEIKKNEDKYQNLVDNINDVIYEITTEGTLKYINNAAYLISGYHPNELIGKNFFEKIYPNDLPLIFKALSELGKEKYIQVEFRFLAKDGKIRWVRSSTNTILENGIAIGGRGVLIDIHETKTAQILLAQNEKKLQFKTRLQKLLVDISNKYINLPLNQLDFKINKSLGDLGQFIGADRFYIFDYDFENKTSSNTYEWCAEGIEAQIEELQNVPIDYIPEWVNAHCEGETLYVEDVLALDPEDNLRIILEPQGIKSLVTVPIIDDGKCLGFTGFDAVKDYHSYSSDEVELLKVFAQMLVNIKNHLKNQHELEKSNQKLNLLLNNLSGVIYHSDFDGRNWNLSFINDAVFELTGYKAADFINNTKIEFNDLIDKEDLPRVLEEVHSATNNKLAYSIEYRIFNAAGQQKWVWENGHGVFDSNKLIGLEGFISDITEKKQIEEELLKSEEELNQAQEIAKMGSWYMNLLTNEIKLSHNYYKLVEREEKDTKSKEDLLLPLIHKDDVHLIENKLAEIAAAKSQGTQELRLIMPDGNIKWVQSTILPVYHNDVLVAYKGVKIDITEKKLQESEINKLISVVEQSPISIMVTNLDGSIEYANPKACEISGYTKEELETKNPRIFKSGETQQQEYSELWKTISSGKEWKGIFHNKKKDGTLYWESANIAPIFDSYGNITQYLALKEDITRKKELGEELALKEFRHSKLAEHSLTVIWEVDANGLYTYVSPLAETVYGFSTDELIGKKHFYEIAPKEAREEVKIYGIKSMRNGELMVNFENQIEKKDGKIIWVSTNGTPFFDKKNNIIGYRGADNDITEKKLQEEEIRLKNANLNAILDAIPDMIFTSDSDGNYLEFFKSFKNKKTIDYSYLIGKNIKDELTEDFAAIHIEKIKECLQTKKMISYEYSMVEDFKTGHFDGRIVFMEDNKVLRFVRDITKRKEQENDIKKLTIAIEQSPNAIVITNLDATIEYVSPAFQKITGYSIEEVIGKKISLLKSGQTNDAVYKNLWTTISAGEIWKGELVNKKKNGDLYWESIIINPIQNENKLITGYLAIKEDITERKRAAKEIIELNANLEVKIEERTLELLQTNNNLQQEIEQRKQIEEALSKSENNYRSVIENVNEVIFKTDENGLWLFLNKSWEEITGFTVEESLGQLFVNYVHPEDRQRNMELFMPLINREKEYCRHQVRYLTKDGGFRWIEIFARLGINEFDEITGTYGTLNDITERKKAEDALEIEKQRLASIIEGTNVGTWEWNIKTGETIFNERWANILGYSLEEISPTSVETFRKYTHPEDFHKSNELLEQHFQRVIDYYSVELRMKHKNGSWVWVLANGKVNAWDTDGKPLVSSGTHLEITKKKEAEEELEIEKQRLASIIEGTNVGTWEWNIKTGETKFNERWANILGYSLEEISPTSIETWVKFSYPEDLHKSNELLEMHFQGTLDYYSFESRMKHRNGSWMWVLDRGKVNKWDQDGKPLLMSGTHQDITEQKEAEEELNWNKTLLELMSNSSPLGFLVVDNTTDNILYFNKRFCQIWGIEHIQDQMERGELKNNDIIPFCIPVLADVPAFAESCKPLQNEDNRIVLDDEIAFNNSRTIRRFTTQIRGNNDEYFGRFYIFEDITEDKRKSEEIIKARNEAMRANKAKSAFLANMSHELRTPLNSILGFSQLLKMSNLSETHKTNVDYIYSSGKHLLNLINEVLDISKIEAGKISLNIEPIQVSILLNEIIETLQPQVNNMNINLKVLNSTCNELYVNADLKRLKQVLLNLLDNAIKYNKKGGFIKITTKIMPKNSMGIVPLRISIMDTGIGISKYDISKIFNPFERIGAEKTEIEGTGLGLSVVKKLIDVMGGNFGVESILDKGSTFWFEFPLVESIKTALNLTSKETELITALADANKELDFQIAEKGKRAHELEIANIEIDFQNEEKGKRAHELEIANKEISNLKEHISKKAKDLTKRPSTILYVEDNILNIKLVKKILSEQYAHINLIIDSTGIEAVKLAIENQPDLILLDLDLPFMQGSEILEFLSKEEKTKRIPVVIITANIFPKKREKLLIEGAKKCINKPIDIPVFLKVLEEYIIKK